MKKNFFRIGLGLQFLLLCLHLFNNRNGLPIPDTDPTSHQLLFLMHTYWIEYSSGAKHTLAQTIWGYDITWASFVIFTILVSLISLTSAARRSSLGRKVALGNMVLWALCLMASLMFWSPPQQIIFTMLLGAFSLSFFFDWRDPKPNWSRVCVVGAGISGLTAAYELHKKGYRNVTVLEKAARIGGKCSTKIEDGHPFDLGGHEMLAGYYDVVSIGEELNAPTRKSIPPLVYDSSKKAYLNFSSSATASGKYSLLEVGWAAMRYLWLTAVTFRSFAQPSASFKNMPEELTMNLDEWLNYRRLNAIRDILVFVIKVQGYGQFSTTPACYLIRFQGWRNWLSLLLSGMGVYTRWPRVFTNGMENLCQRMAATLADVRTNITIQKIVRKEGAAKDGISVYLQGISEPMVFDKLIVSAAVAESNLNFMDFTKEERGLFESFSSFRFYTTLTRAQGLASGVVASNPMNDIVSGEYTGYIKDFSEEPFTIFFSLALKPDVDGRVVKEKISEVLERIPAYEGVKPSVVEFINQKEWHYFPHITTNVAATFNGIEELQGKKNTYYAFSGLTFECVGTCVAYSKRLIQEHF